MNEQEQSMIEDYLNIWLERDYKPTEKQKAVEPFLETISEEFDQKLFGYIAELQHDAFYGGFAMAMKLAADCYAENKKVIRRA